jgi:hypothetical protein
MTCDCEGVLNRVLWDLNLAVLHQNWFLVETSISQLKSHKELKSD